MTYGRVIEGGGCGGVWREEGTTKYGPCDLINEQGENAGQ